MNRSLTALALALALTAAAGAQRPFAGKPEAGLVSWESSHAAARERASREKKPLLVFFQEIPG